MANDLTVTFGVDLSGLADGLDQARDQIAQATDAMNSSFEDASASSGQALNGLFNGIGASVNAASQSFDGLTDSAQEQATAQDGVDAGMLASRMSMYQQLSAADDTFNAHVRQNSDETTGWLGLDWTKLGNDLRNSFSRSLASMIVSGTSFQKALQQIGQSVLSDFINQETQRVWSWLSAEADLTAATIAGTTERNALEQSSTTGSIGATAEKALASIGNYAAETFAGVFAFLSDLLGPAAAGPAAAAEATVQSVAGSVAFAERGFDVPRDTFAYLHKDEMVLPASLAGQVRGAASAGGGVGAAPVINLAYTAQGRTTAHELLGHSRTIASAVARELRHFNPNLRMR